jgi:peptidoglycan hydrolase-like protein with peptidoglycan-binding domain
VLNPARQILARKRSAKPDEDVVENGWPRPRVMVIASLYGALGLAIIANATVFQPVKVQGIVQNDQSIERPDLISEGLRSNTVIIKYDPAVEEVQRELLAAGEYDGLVDGIFGDRTKAAIVTYQTSNDIDPTGKITPELIESLRYRRTLAAAAEYTATTGSAEPEKQRDPKNRILNVESALSDLGYDPGDIDGRMSDALHAAIRKFEIDHKLPVTGEINDAVLAELAKTTGYEDIATR